MMHREGIFGNFRFGEKRSARGLEVEVHDFITLFRGEVQEPTTALRSCCGSTRQSNGKCMKHKIIESRKKTDNGAADVSTRAPVSILLGIVGLWFCGECANINFFVGVYELRSYVLLTFLT
uniref:Uncharacterized protein n=1 Tax=Pseudictyota dubia TaxID=2749911 RepID=A0A7R9ZF53_9STRA